MGHSAVEEKGCTDSITCLYQTPKGKTCTCASNSSYVVQTNRRHVSALWQWRMLPKDWLRSPEVTVRWTAGRKWFPTSQLPHTHSFCCDTPTPCLRPTCFAPFCFNAPCQRTPLFNLRLLIFGLAPFGWLPSSTLTWTYTIISYGSIIFYLRLFDRPLLFQEHN
jgi:hypothetical protein